MSARKQFLLLVFITLICKTSATKLTSKEYQALTKYKCTLGERKKNTNSCKVKIKDEENRKVSDSNLPKPSNCKLTLKTDEKCEIYGMVKFAYIGLFDQKVEGFMIESYNGMGGPTKYQVTLPKSYSQSKGGSFEINMKSFDSFFISPNGRFKLKVSALPKSSNKCESGAVYFSASCLDYEEYQRKGCKEEDINICPNTTTITSTMPSETTPQPSTSGSSNITSFVTILLCSTSIFIIIAVVAVCKLRKKANDKKRVAVMLASSGDGTSKFTDMANLIASQLQSSDIYEQVIFTGWMPVNSVGNNLEKIVDALHNSTVVILFVSPFGKSSYEKFLEQGQLATWKDEFVIGANSLFRTSNHTTLISSKLTASKRKILVVYHCEEPLQKSDFLHKDFKLHAHRCYDLNVTQDNTDLYKQLLGHQTRMIYNGETCIEEDSTTKLI